MIPFAFFIVGRWMQSSLLEKIYLCQIIYPIVSSSSLTIRCHMTIRSCKWGLENEFLLHLCNARECKREGLGNYFWVTSSELAIYPVFSRTKNSDIHPLSFLLNLYFVFLIVHKHNRGCTTYQQAFVKHAEYTSYYVSGENKEWLIPRLHPFTQEIFTDWITMWQILFWVLNIRNETKVLSFIWRLTF